MLNSQTLKRIALTVLLLSFAIPALAQELDVKNSETARMTMPINPATATISTDELLNLMPADSLFCVRINNLDQALALTDLFLADAAPLPPGVKVAMIIQGQLATILADPMLTNVSPLKMPLPNRNS